MTPGGGPGDRLRSVLSRARDLGFFGPGPVDDQLSHAEAFVAAIADRSGALLDLGSGGGLPGLVLAVRRPDLEIVLVDSAAKRVAFLTEAIVDVGAGDRCRAEQGRAEVLGHGPLRGAFDVVTARSFGPPAVTAECGAPFLRVGGALVVSEPPAAADRWPADGLAAVGLVLGPAIAGPPRLQVLEQHQICPPDLPRRDGVPAKRPLF